MRRILRLALVVLPVVAAVGAPAIASADDDDILGEKGLQSHAGQFGAHLQLGTGYRGILSYDDEYCGERASDGSSELCLGRAPLHMDVGASYAVSRSIEVFLELRFGMETDFGTSANADGPRVFHFAPGMKFYLGDAGRAKFFSTIQLVIDDTQYEQTDGVDLGVKNTSGLQLDVHEAVGIYVWFGEVVGFSRWLRFQMEFGVGMQARF